MNADRPVLLLWFRRCAIGLWLAIYCCIATRAYAQLNQSPKIQLLGQSSCASSNCHGSVVGVGPAWLHAMRKWETTDPHTLSGRRLESQTAVEMVHRLDPTTRDSKQSFDRVMLERCAPCHGTVQRETGSGELRALPEGISCEACHGPAREWIQLHTQKRWSDLGESRFRSAPGMRNLRTLDGLTVVCGRCHIGSHTEDQLVRDMNHDIIAAGHPPLHFELQSYLQSLTPHWDVDNQVTWQSSTDRAKQWHVGRILSLRYAMKLTRERVESRRGPWPEFSEYACFSCHQSVATTVSSAHDLVQGDSHRTTLSWQPWFAGASPLIIEPSLQASFDSQRKQLERTLRLSKVEFLQRLAAIDQLLASTARQSPTEDAIALRVNQYKLTEVAGESRGVNSRWMEDRWEEIAQWCLAVHATKSSQLASTDADPTKFAIQDTVMAKIYQQLMEDRKFHERNTNFDTEGKSLSRLNRDTILKVIRQAISEQ